LKKDLICGSTENSSQKIYFSIGNFPDYSSPLSNMENDSIVFCSEHYLFETEKKERRLNLFLQKDGTFSLEFETYEGKKYFLIPFEKYFRRGIYQKCRTGNIAHRRKGSPKIPSVRKGMGVAGFWW
jgi:hypothetical protein